MTVRISVCIPVWNESEWLSGAIESVLAQDYSDWELVISDNASEEDLASIVAGFDDPRIRYHRFAEHVDVYESFNRACQLCNFEWIHPLSADDRLNPDCLSTIAARIQEAGNARLAAVIADCHRVDSEGKDATALYFGHQQIVPVPDGTYSASQWFDLMSVPSQVPWNLGAIAFNREVLVESGWFRPDVGYGADMELVLRISAYGDISYIGQKLMRYTVRGSSDSSGRSLRLLHENGRMTAMEAAWESAIRSHETKRIIPPEQMGRIKNVIARSHIQRALNHRLFDRGRGRRGALLDLWRAYTIYPNLLTSPRHVGASALALFAPRTAVSSVMHRLTTSRRGPDTPVSAPTRV